MTEDGAEDEVAAPKRGRPKPGPILVGVLGLLLVAALVGLGLTYRSLHHARQLDDAAHQAEAAARKVSVEMTTYDYRTLDEDFDWVDDAGTAKFRENFKDVSAPTKQLVASLKATARGKVIDSAADAENADHVRVVLFVDQTLTSAPEQGSKIDQPRITMHMVRKGDSWLVDSVELNNLLGKE